MPVKVIIQNAAAGASIRVHSTEKPDRFLFRRNPERWNQHEMDFPTAEAFNAVSRDLLCAKGNPPMHVIITPDTPAGTGGAEVEQLRADLAHFRTRLAEALEQLQALEGKARAQKRRKE